MTFAKRNVGLTLIRWSACALFVAGVTFLYSVVFEVNSTTVALTFLLLTLAIATKWGLLEAIATSIIAMLCFNFFFLEPVGTLTIADPQNWVALFAFLITAIVTSQLSDAVKKRAAKQNEAMKAMLLDALAHEFKTPLTSIKAAASSILEETGPGQVELRAVIEEEADRLNALVNEVMRMAHIDAGDLKLQMRAQRVEDLIASALKELKLLIEDRDIQTNVDRDLPDVFADGELAALTLRQLLTNALKYSSPDSPIEIRARSEDSFVRFSVTDHGPGIPAKERPRVFDRYYRMSQNADGVPGTGLGLHIARNIVEAHGGGIGVQSDPERGCEFFFTLPVAKDIR